MPLFSVVIPTYNRVSYIRQALASLELQTFRDFEVIVVDDGSTDSTPDVLKQFPAARIIRQANRGPGAARNRGVEACSGEYVAFLDSDCVWFPWSLATFSEAIERYERPALVASKLVEFGAEENLPLARPRPLRAEHFEDYFTASDRSYFFGGPTMIIRKAVFEAVHGFLPEHIYVEDIDLALRLGQAPGFVQILSPVTVASRLHESSARGNRTLMTAGVRRLVDMERDGFYPGGAGRQLERWRLLTLTSRPLSLECLSKNDWSGGWAAYRATFRWNVRLGRWRYLLGFPAYLALSVGREVLQLSRRPRA